MSDFKDKIKLKTKSELQAIKTKKDKAKTEKIKEKLYHQKILDELDGVEDDKVFNSRTSTHSFWKEKCDVVIAKLDSEIVDLDNEIAIK